MADPLSIASGIAGLLSLGIQVTQSLVNFYNAYKDQDGNLARIMRNLLDLRSIFQSLKTAVQDSRSQANAQELLKEVDKTTQRCQEIIEELQVECQKFDASLSKSIIGRVQVAGRRVAYPFRKSTLQKLEEDIGEIRENLSLALNVLQVKNESLIQFDMSEIRLLIETINATQISSSIRDWLKAPDASIDHDIASRKRHPKTGLWLANNENFAAWLVKRNSFLWINGFAGCGKSVLCSTAIQHTFRKMKDMPSVGVAFFYFSFTDGSKQNENGKLRALLLQLSSQIPDGETELKKLYEAHIQKTPTVDALLESLRRVVSLFDEAFISLDAIDESPREIEREGVLAAVETIRKWDLPGLHVLVTSRKEFDIKESFNVSSDEVLSMKNPEVDKDISNFISDQLKDDKKIQRWKAFHGEIQEKLTERAQGVFRYVECQLKELRRARNENQLIDCLKSLPRDLDATYERILGSIDERYIDDVRRILTVLCISRRPLAMDELIEAHTVDLSEPQHADRKRTFHEDDILDICLGLVEISEHVNAIGKKILTTRIAHFSVQEYLQSSGILQQNASVFAVQTGSANTEMAQICLVYLLNPMLCALDKTSGTSAFPLAHYAANNWHSHHLGSGEGQLTVEPLITRLFSNEVNSFSWWISIYYIPRYDRLIMGAPNSIAREGEPLWYAAYLGLDFVLDNLTSSGDWQLSNADTVDSTGRKRYSALEAASYGGHVKAVQMLLERGADAEQFDDALYVASSKGQEQVAQILLDRGANPNNPDYGPRGSAFDVALHSGHERVVQLLLDRGVDVNSSPDSLVHALGGRNAEFVQILLDRGADVNAKSKSGSCALHVAASSNKVKIVQILLDNGADVNIKNVTGKTLIEALSSHRLEPSPDELEIMQMLLDRGANIGSALQIASYNGYEEVVNLLLDQGVDINARGRIFVHGLTLKFLNGDALQLASLAGNEKIVELLLQRGANITARSELFNDAPHALSFLNSNKVIQILVD